MKSIIQKSGASHYAKVDKKEFPVGQEVLVIPYDRSKDQARCRFDPEDFKSLVKDAVAEALAEARG